MKARLDRGLVLQHLQDHAGLYIFVLVFYTVGVVFGALGVNALDPAQKSELGRYLDGFFQILAGETVKTNPAQAWQKGAGINLRTAALVWLGGITIIGLPLVLALVFLRGFVVGFAVGFLVFQKGLRGVLFAASAILPHNLLAVPALFVLSVSAISFAIFAYRHRNEIPRLFLGREMAGYTAILLAVAGVLLAASALEAYVVPVLMRLAARFV